MGIKHRDFAKLKLFAHKDTDLKNSKIQDVTLILEQIILSKESFKPGHKMIRFLKKEVGIKRVRKSEKRK